MNLYDLYYPVRIYESDIPGWYEYRQYYEMPIERKIFSQVYAMFDNISIIDICNEYHIIHVNAPRFTIVDSPPLYLNSSIEKALERKYKEIEITLEELTMIHLATFDFIEDQGEWLRDKIKHSFRDAIDKRKWTYLLIREDSLNVGLNLVITKTWRQFMAYHNRLGRVDEKKEKKLKVKLSTYIGGYNKNEVLVN